MKEWLDEVQERYERADQPSEAACWISMRQSVADVPELCRRLRLALDVIDEVRLKHAHGYGETKLTCPICQELESFDAAQEAPHA